MKYLNDIDYSTAEAADSYDELPLWSAPFGLLMLDRVPIRLGLTIADIGCGTGFLSIELAQRCGPKCRVIAIDIWAAALTRLRRKLDHLVLQNVQVMEQDAANLALPDATFDLLVSNLGINNFDNLIGVLKECYRVAKPGAALCLTTNLAGHMAEFYDVYRIALDELGFDGRLLDDHVARRGTIETISQSLALACFEVTTSTTESFRLRFADGTSLLRHYFIRLGFVGGWKSVLPPKAIEAFFAILERNLNEVAAQRGELALTIPIAYIEARKCS